MRFEQKKRDKEVKVPVTLALSTIKQLNLLFPRLQKALINSVGYKLSLETCVLKMKQVKPPRRSWGTSYVPPCARFS